MPSQVLICNPPWDQRYHSIRAGSRWPHTQGLESQYAPFPFFQAYATALLKRSGVTVQVIDALADRLTTEEFWSRYDLVGPSIVLTETSTPSYHADLQFAKQAKASNRPIVILAGTHVSTYPEAALSDPNVDVVLRGEYEYSALETITSILDGKDLTQVEGIGLKKNGKAILTEKRPLLKDLDALPWPDRDLYNLDSYYDPLVPRPQVQMLASRGCPFRCIFCLWNQVLYEERLRSRAPESVLDEMSYIVHRYRPRSIYFDDDCFTSMEKNKILRLCALLNDHPLGVEWGCMGHVSTVDREMLRAMSKAGCRAIKFGIETANQGILQAASKGMTPLIAKKAVKMANEVGIRTHATFVFGLPGETKKTILQTIRFVKELRPDTAQFSIAVPFPGTSFFEMARANDWLITSDWRAYDGSRFSAIRMNDLEPRDLERAVEKAYRELCGHGIFGRSFDAAAEFLHLCQTKGLRYALGRVNAKICHVER